MLTKLFEKFTDAHVRETMRVLITRPDADVRITRTSRSSARMLVICSLVFISVGIKYIYSDNASTVRCAVFVLLAAVVMLGGAITLLGYAQITRVLVHLLQRRHPNQE